MLQTMISTAVVVLVSMSNAGAAPADDACATLLEVRGHLLAMVDNTDHHAVRDDLKHKVYAASAKLESIVGEMADSDAAKAKAFKPIWEQFKKTREKEIIPAVYAGRKAYAKTIAGGIQSARVGKMKAALGCM